MYRGDPPFPVGSVSMVLPTIMSMLPTGDIGACLGRHLVRGAKHAARKKKF